MKNQINLIHNAIYEDIEIAKFEKTCVEIVWIRSWKV